MERGGISLRTWSVKRKREGLVADERGAGEDVPSRFGWHFDSDIFGKADGDGSSIDSSFKAKAGDRFE